MSFLFVSQGFIEVKLALNSWSSSRHFSGVVIMCALGHLAMYCFYMTLGC